MNIDLVVGLETVGSDIAGYSLAVYSQPRPVSAVIKGLAVCKCGEGWAIALYPLGLPLLAQIPSEVDAVRVIHQLLFKIRQWSDHFGFTEFRESVACSGKAFEVLQDTARRETVKFCWVLSNS